MTAYWLTYKPLSPASKMGWPAEKMRDLVRRFLGDPSDATPLWRISAYQTAKAGDRVYLFKQGDDPRGIFGVGKIIEPARLQYDPDDIEQGARHRVKIRFDALVDPESRFLLDLPDISDFVPGSLVNANASGTTVSETAEMELERLLEPLFDRTPRLTDELSDDDSFDPDSVGNERERAIRAIRLRRGQAAFRAELMHAYNARCAVTGCAIKDVLEAAHITPHLGRVTNHVTNGLLLRADLHTLLDCNLIPSP
jgi:putative restriction endonuclease